MINTQTIYPNSSTTTSMDHEQHQDQQVLDLNQDHEDKTSSDHQNLVKHEPIDDNCELDLDLDFDQDDHKDNVFENTLDYEPGPFYCTDNDPPESYAVCEAKVADWLSLNQHTFIERKASVKFACQTRRSSNRSVSLTLNQRPKLSIIGFKEKPVQQSDGKSKHNDKVRNVRLFRNRSEPGRDYCLLITEPVSPKVSCVGRVGSVRVQGRKAGVWRSLKSVFSNMVKANRVMKVVA